MHPDLDKYTKEFTGSDLLQLVIAIESTVGSFEAGATPLGSAIIRLCEEAANKDEQSQQLQPDKETK